MNRFESYKEFIGEHNREEVEAYLNELDSILKTYTELEEKLVTMREEYRTRLNELREEESKGSALTRIKTKQTNYRKYKELNQLSDDMNILRNNLREMSTFVFMSGIKKQMIEEELNVHD